ncbi:diguanylate cyclase domain-containing protein [Niveibacterium umoris]|uniref:diguanylate cyclase n=2 Tax=Niveibacterium umoris TaxID=1193620 RepID=A0A840BMN5_9RHOO|nr:diguanylate cyclase [Niveibacterium umoris]MBB4014250.1 diguanylate cyclase (GGDEF)-like protein [Niveibacterium umoris]
MRHALPRALRALALAACALVAATGLGQDARPFSDADIDAIDLAGRGNPAGAVEQINARLAAGGITPGQQLTLHALRGIFLVDAGQSAAAAKVANELEAQPTPEAQGAALLVRSQIEAQNGSLARGIALADQAAAALKDSGNLRLQFRVAMTRGWELTELGQFPLALERYGEAIQLAEQIKNPALALRAHNSRGSVLAQAGETKRAMHELDTALAIANRLKDPTALTVTWTSRAVVASFTNDLAEQLQASERASEYARKTDSATLIATTELNLGDVYLRTKRYPEALATSLRAVDIARKVGDESTAAIALANAGQAEIRMGRLASGKAKIEKALESSQRMKARTQLATLLGEYATALEAAGDYQAALDAFHRERSLNEELFSEGQKRALLEIESRYQSERKQTEIDLLNQKNALQASELRNRALQQRVWLLAAALLLCGLVAIGLLYRRVRSANRQLEQSNELLKVRSERDPLTQLLNRRAFLDTQTPGELFTGALFLLDIDHFKRINDVHGHAAGDAVIVEVAQRLRTATRDSDRVMRWGGEEFLIATTPMPQAQADRMATRVLQAIGGAPIPIPGGELVVRASLGYIVFPLAGSTGLTAERGINLADLALYAAKNQGRNRACGIVSLAAASGEAVGEIERNFETACHDGRVTLRYIEGCASDTAPPRLP